MNYLRGLIDDIKVWRRVRVLYKKNEEQLLEKGYHIDWIGRIYKVINRDFNIKIGDDIDHALILEETQNFDKELQIYGINTLVTISYQPIVSDTENSYLVIFQPEAHPEYRYLRPCHFYAVPIFFGVITLTLILNLIF